MNFSSPEQTFTHTQQHHKSLRWFFIILRILFLQLDHFFLLLLFRFCCSVQITQAAVWFLSLFDSVHKWFLTSCHRLLIGPFLQNELTLACAVIWGHFTWGQPHRPPPSWLVRLFVWSRKGSRVWPEEPLTFLVGIWGDVGSDKTSGLSTCMWLFFLYRCSFFHAVWPFMKKSRKWHFTVTVCIRNQEFLACPCCLTASFVCDVCTTLTANATAGKRQTLPK